jgi:hypothetical protein
MLNNLQINTKEIIVEFPRFKDFKLKMCYIPREELSSIRDRSLKISFNKVDRKREETLDTDKFMEAYISRAVVGWSGLTLGIVAELVPVEVSAADLDKDVPYSHEDAMWLVKNSSEFDTFISDTMNSVDTFSAKQKEDQRKK